MAGSNFNIIYVSPTAPTSGDLSSVQSIVNESVGFVEIGNIPDHPTTWKVVSEAKSTADNLSGATTPVSADSDGKKRTLYSLVKGFTSVFPNSEWKPLINNVRGIKVEGAEFLILRTTAEVRSAVDPSKSYRTWITLRRPDKSTPWTPHLGGEIKCSCPAFQFWVAHPDLVTKNYDGNPTAWARKRFVNAQNGRVRNPQMYPGMCKHLVGLTMAMGQAGVLSL